MKIALLAAALAVATFPFIASPALAQDHSAHGHGTAKVGAGATALSEGTVKKIDRAAGKITLAHGPLENLGMPPMTMSFAIDKGLLPAAVKEGDKVRFRAEEQKGTYRVVRLEAAK